MQEWSTELAAVAKHYAEQCIFKHNPHRSAQVHLFSYVGENIAITNNPTPDYIQLVHGWYNESRYYDITTGECTDQECLHYAQVNDSQYHWTSLTKYHSSIGVVDLYTVV